MIRSGRAGGPGTSLRPDAPAPGTFEVLSGHEAHQRLLATAIAAYSFAGGLTMWLVVLVVEIGHTHLPKFRSAPLAVLGLSAWLVGALFWWGRDRIPAWAFDPAFVAGTATISLAVYLAGPSGGPAAAPLYIGLAVAGVIMLPRTSAMVHITLVAVAYAIVLAFEPGIIAAPTRWVAVVGTSVLMAGIAGWVVNEVRTLAEAEDRSRARGEEAMADLGTLTRRKRDFLANMSHELRTPLNAIIGFAEVLAQELFGALNHRQIAYVRDIAGSGRQLLTLINDILDLAKVEAGRMELDIDEVDVADLLDGVVRSFASDASERGVDVALVVDPGVGTMPADPHRLRQIVAILLSNALRHSPMDSTMEVRALRGDDGVLVAVRARGPGGPPDDEGPIFDEFGQLAPPGRATPGVGLGLPLARAFAGLHHGRVDVTSGSDEAGSVFLLMLPVDTTACRAPRAETQAARPAAGLPRAIWGEGGVFEVLVGPQRHRTLIARGVAAYSAAGGLLMLVGGYLGDGVLPHFHRDAVTALGVYCLALAGVVLLMGGRLQTRAYLALAVVSAATISALAYYVGPIGGPIAACGYVCLGIGVFLYLPSRQALAVIAAMGLGYGIVLAVQDGNAVPAARWLVTVANVAATGLLVSWVSGRVRALAEASYAARSSADIAQAELEAANDEQSAFLAKMSHELRTPLNAIIGFSEVLAEELFGPLSEKQAEYVGDIVGGGRHLLALTNEILDLSKVEAGRIDLERTVFDLAPSLGTSAAMFREQARRQGLTLRVDIDPAIGAIEADERKVHQVVVNLLSNAVKFTAPGGEVHLVARRDDGNVSIVVSDTGVGIDRVDQGAIFDDFIQAGSSPGGVAAGTGLGLGLAKRFVDLHHGELELMSAPGQGTTVAVRLPIGEVGASPRT